jgi:hypothetical protein
MDRSKKIGIMLIIVGIFIPLIFYPFTELTKDVKEKADLLLAVRGVKYSPRLNELKVGSWDYPSIIAVGFISIFVGVSIIVLSRKGNSEPPNWKKLNKRRIIWYTTLVIALIALVSFIILLRINPYIPSLGRYMFPHILD